MGYILRVRGEDGALHDIPALVGPQGEPGESASLEALTNSEIEKLLK